MKEILQSHLPEEQRAQALARLPAMKPVGEGGWLTIDDAYSGQLAEKARLMGEMRDRVCAVLPEAEAAVAELLDVILGELALRSDFVVGDVVRRPDGVEVVVDRGDPLGTLSQLVQEDLCIMQKDGEEHKLTAALLCFPAAWTLAQKLGRPLTLIHTPVPQYSDDIAKRVQRFFDGVQTGRPLWRANLHKYDDPTLFHVRPEGQPRPYSDKEAPYERSERQTVLRLPETNAVLFAIHTTMVRRQF